jgi:hypothetical protein
LADNDRAGANQQDFLDVVTTWHRVGSSKQRASLEKCLRVQLWRNDPPKRIVADPWPKRRAFAAPGARTTRKREFVA